MASRGPDGKGEWYSRDGRVGLAHRRLSIVDLSERGAQPMITRDGRYVISFNGEIYNYRALRKELEEDGYQFQSHSDTEVLLYLYQARGDKMFQSLRGMYAFAVWDGVAREMFLARDPYGIKPLYYADDGWTVRVASQVKAIRAGGRVSDSRDPAGIVGFYLFGSVPEPYTCWQEIRSVPAGCSIRITELGPQPAKMHTSTTGILAATDEEYGESARPGAREVVREALLDSIRDHRVADVPVGTFLSAGIDSGVLVGLTSELSAPGSLQTITLGFDEFRGQPEDETVIAQDVARQYGVGHRLCYTTQEEFTADLPRIFAAMDQPSIDGVNSWFVAKAASGMGLKVAMSGVGGDELFGGYPSFTDIPRWVSRFGLAARITGLGDVARLMTAMVSGDRQIINPKAFALLKYAHSYSGAWFVRRGLFMPWELEKLVGSEVAREGLRRLSPFDYIGNMLRPDPVDPFRRIAALESSLYLRNQLLRDADWAGMAHSLEIRTPLVDWKLLRRLSGLSRFFSNGMGKRILAGTPATPLPASVIQRGKTGFGTPVQRWLQQVECLQTWRRVPMLQNSNCQWARRWAYSVFQSC